jgi:UTP--glucose-1-phosphate uridylyltransferase
MTSRATDAPIRAVVADRGRLGAVDTFRQYESVRLDPSGRPFLDAEGNPSAHATGHGDLPQALDESGLLRTFVEHGGRYVVIANLDNVGASIDPALLAHHAESGRELTVELVDKRPGDRGGIPLAVDGRAMIVEEFRLPSGFDPASVPYFNTNTLTVNAEALAASVDFDWTWCLARKTVDDRPVVQFERLLGELARGLESGFVVVPRDGDRSRFLPVKDLDELHRIRSAVTARVAALGET